MIIGERRFDISFGKWWELRLAEVTMEFRINDLRSIKKSSKQTCKKDFHASTSAPAFPVPRRQFMIFRYFPPDFSPYLSRQDRRSKSILIGFPRPTVEDFCSRLTQSREQHLEGGKTGNNCTCDIFNASSPFRRHT